MRHFILLSICSVILICFVNAQDEIPKLPGYVPLEELPLFQNQETTLEVQIGESMIGLVASGAERDNPEFSRVLRKLKQVRSFSFDLSGSPRNIIDQYLGQMNSMLVNDRWEVVYRMREPEATANIYMKTVDGNVAGMTIYSIDQSDQIIVVNLVGNISLEDISELAARFGLPEFSP